MRYAYHWSGIPPRGWLITAVLFYDGVLIPGERSWHTLDDFAEIDDVELPCEQDKAIIRALSADPTGAICTVGSLVGAEDRELAEGMDYAAINMAYAVRSAYRRQEMIDAGRDQCRDHPCESVRIGGDIMRHMWERSGPSKGEWEELFQTFLAQTGHEGKIDVFIDRYSREITRSDVSLGPLTVHVPASPERLSPTQIIEFRETRELERVRFRTAYDQLIASFGAASTEVELRRLLRLAEQAIAEQSDILLKNYKIARIESTTAEISTVGGTPPIIPTVETLWHLAASGIANLVASLLLSVPKMLIAKEKAELAVQTSPWSYLWYLRSVR